MESYIQKYFLSNNEDVNEEILLERRISPYVTLRPGDLASLLKSTLPLPVSKSTRDHGSYYNYRKIDTIFEKFPQGLSDSDDEKDGNEIVCRAADQGHVPAEYRVKGLKRHEMPVIGEYIDYRFVYNL